MVKTDKKETINKIIRFNRAWKLAKQRYGDNSAISILLRDQKANLQAELLHNYSGVFLLLDESTDSDEPVYSVKLESAIEIESLGFVTNAEHIPVRIAEALFSKKQLSELIKAEVCLKY